MTGYGRAAGVFKERQISVEIKTLNSKQLDFSFRQPAVYAEFEPEIRNLVSQFLERGKVYCNIQIDECGQETAPEINAELAHTWLRQFKILEEKLTLNPQDDYLPLLLKMPDVLKPMPQNTGSDEHRVLQETVIAALEQVMIFRRKEGAELAKDISMRISKIASMLEKIIPLEESRISRIRERMMKTLSETSDFDTKTDINRFEQELIYYIEKIDITEERIRLGNHLNYFFSVMEEQLNNGRKLGFIAQEIGREINTLGSKAYDSDIQKIVVDMKDELEKVKEQLFNVL